MNKKILAVLVTLFAMLGFGAAVAPAASAGTCTAPGICGKVWNVSYTSYLSVRCNFGDPNSTRALAPRQHSTALCPDIDQVYVPAGYDVEQNLGDGWFRIRTTGWAKITDAGFERQMRLVRE